VRFQSADDFTVVNEENETAMSFARDTKAKIVRFGLKDRQPIALNIAGAHNQLNAQGALAAAMAMGVSCEAACNAVRVFKGLPHRLQLVHESNGVRWINDSIATIPDAAIAAMQSFPRSKVIQIVGGSDKGLDMSPMCDWLAQNCKAILTIGKLGPSLAEKIRHTPSRCAELFECESLDRAVDKARRLASTGDVVLLSTGCASYDQFDNFEQRGEAFAKLARA
jgi:UDP-N-acetylmuramoylalanine--D-glutamate ligase